MTGWRKGSFFLHWAFFRYDVTVANIEKYCSNLLPSRQFGHLVLTTAYGIMDHEDARRKHTGGKILGFFF